MYELSVRIKLLEDIRDCGVGKLFLSIGSHAVNNATNAAIRVRLKCFIKNI